MERLVFGWVRDGESEVWFELGVFRRCFKGGWVYLKFFSGFLWVL